MNKETIKKVLEFLSDKRNRAFIIFGLYVVFFIFVAVMFRIYSVDNSKINDEKVTETSIQKYSKMTNYEYDLIYETDKKTVESKGKVFRKNVYLSLEDNNYFVNDNVYKIDGDSFIPSTIDFIYLIKPEEINTYIINGTVVGKNEDYQNNILETKYSVPSTMFNNDNSSDKNIYITICEQDNTINKVILDITDYINSGSDKETSKALITISYFNVGNVSNFATMFDEAKVIKGVE